MTKSIKMKAYNIWSECCTRFHVSHVNYANFSLHFEKLLPAWRNRIWSADYDSQPDLIKSLSRKSVGQCVNLKKLRHKYTTVHLTSRETISTQSETYIFWYVTSRYSILHYKLHCLRQSKYVIFIEIGINSGIVHVSVTYTIFEQKVGWPWRINATYNKSEITYCDVHVFFREA